MTSIPPLTRPGIGVAISGPTTERALATMREVAGRADIVELRIDLFQEPADLKRLLEERTCPTVVTCRSPREGGRFSGSEEDRLDRLREAASLGAEYVDVEAFAYPQLGPLGETKAIVSQHSFTEMPPDLGSRWAHIRALGADVVKVAGFAQNALENLPVLDVLAQADRSTIAMAMGPGGLASRILALRYPHALLTYASPDSDEGTAPGQIRLSVMLTDYRADRITLNTHVFGIIATELESELAITYNALLDDADIDGVCVPLIAADSELELIERLRSHGAAGYHIHGPAQERLFHQLPGVTPVAKARGKVNSVIVTDQGLLGDFVQSPADQVLAWQDSARISSPGADS